MKFLQDWPVTGSYEDDGFENGRKIETVFETHNYAKDGGGEIWKQTTRERHSEESKETIHSWFERKHHSSGDNQTSLDDDERTGAFLHTADEHEQKSDYRLISENWSAGVP